MFDGSIIPSSGDLGHPLQEDLGPQPQSSCIGLFDSGVGGLSVLRALQREMPWLDYIYCGDTARLPYGKRKPETIIEYSMQASRFLIDSGADAIVIACNTASSVALDAVQKAYPGTLIKGVVEAGVQAAMEATRTRRIGVIGTECTVASKAYERALTELDHTVEVHSQPCSFLVSLAEEGWTECDIAATVVKRYLEPLFDKFGSHRPDTLILGCTHFSRFSSVIQEMAGADMTLIDPADHLAQTLKSIHLRPEAGSGKATGATRLHATDALQRFARVGELFLGTQIPLNSLQRISLDNH